MDVDDGYPQDVYEDTYSISTSLVGTGDINSTVQHDLEIGAHHIGEKAYESGSKCFRAAMALSYAVAGYYKEDDRDFFDLKQDNFEEFVDDFSGGKGSRNDLNGAHLVQYADLYSRVCEEEGVEPSQTGSGVALMSNPEKQDAVLEILEDLDEEL